MPAEVGDWDEATTGEKEGRRTRPVGSTQDVGRGEESLQQEFSRRARDDTEFAEEEEVLKVFDSLTCFPGLLI